MPAGDTVCTAVIVWMSDAGGRVQCSGRGIILTHMHFRSLYSQQLRTKVG